ncbi:hypothetical protein [Calothrix sp. NIES-2098]|uniref:hypothetical protein n=1 Tax=Calothrix sp. NIES-2098 TaxID=1954171 RepID=UPI000B6170EE|nr:hypothetical protein NIES2098_48840 [Calothrix sp. NIES-2098]
MNISKIKQIASIKRIFFILVLLLLGILLAIFPAWSKISAATNNEILYLAGDRMTVPQLQMVS